MATNNLAGTSSSNAYGSTNTKSYADDITQQYSDYVAENNASIDTAVDTGVATLENAQAAGEQKYSELGGVAAADLKEAKAVESGIEQNAGNRQGIGHSQYGTAEQTYDTQRANIQSAVAALKRDTARQISDLKAQGEYQKADALLASKQQELQMMYEDALRVDSNLRGNYEYQTELQREDEEIQREQDEAELEYIRSLGQAFLQKGVMPTDSMLEAMNMDSDTAQLYINAVKAAGYSYSSGSSSGSSKKTTTTPTTTANTPTYGSISAYSSSIAKQIYSLAEDGNLDAARKMLSSSYAYFSEANFKLVGDTATKKYYQTAEKYSKYF